MRKQLQVRIHPDGKIDAKTLGITGSECTNYITALEQLLDARTVESSYTEEYYQSEIQETAQINIQQAKN